MLLVGPFAACGCGWSGPPSRRMAAVSGVVLLDGKPLTDGFVTFVSPQEGRFEAFPLKEGRYAGKASLGVRTVEIVAIRDSEAAPAVDEKSPPKATRENYLPAKYSTASALRADVTEAGPNVFNFDLTMGK